MTRGEIHCRSVHIRPTSEKKLHHGEVSSADGHVERREAHVSLREEEEDGRGRRRRLTIVPLGSRVGPRKAFFMEDVRGWVKEGRYEEGSIPRREERRGVTQGS